MHEFGIAQSLMRLVNEGAKKNNAKSVSEISVKIGQYAGIEKDLLERAFDEIKKNTIADGARLNIILEPFQIRCNDCSKSFKHPYLNLVCPDCLRSNTTVISGQTIELTELEISG